MRNRVAWYLRVVIWWLRVIQMGGSIIATLLGSVRLGPYKFEILRSWRKGYDLAGPTVEPRTFRKNWKSHVRVRNLNGRVCVEKLFVGGLRERLKCFVEVSHLWRLRDIKVAPSIVGFDPVKSAIYMELIEGITLKEFLEQCAACELKSSNEVQKRVLARFLDLNQNGLFVNDVHSRNIIIDEGGNVRVVDLAEAVSVSSLPGALRQRFYSLDLVGIQRMFEGGQRC